MEKGRKRIFFVLMLCLVLTGCGNKGKTTENQEGGNTGEWIATPQNASEEKILDETGKEIVDDDGFTVTNDYVKTIGENVNVRLKPTTESDIYMVLDNGVDLNRTGYNAEWTRVKLNGSNFYVSSEYVEETQVQWATTGNADRVSHVIFIDPAKQILSDSETEPIGPGAEDKKAKAASGASGVSTGNYEYEITLAVAELLKEELNKRGYTVYMSRDSNDVKLSNAERAVLANSREAEIYVKLQAGSSTDAGTSGVMGFVTTAGNIYSGTYHQQSYDLCNEIVKAICGDTGAERLGIYETEELTTINWCKMPAAVVNIGFLSNEADDTALASEDYRKKLANAVADGIDLYFEGESEE